MSEKKELYYPYENTDNFIIADIAGSYQKDIDNYNEAVKNPGSTSKGISVVRRGLLGCEIFYDKSTPLDFVQSMILLEVALKKREVYGFEWGPGVHVAFVNNQIEVCRELMNAKEISREASGSRKELKAIRKQDKDENPADILGLIIDELAADGLTEEDYDTLMSSFAKILVEWKELDAPKIRQKKAYGILHRLLNCCFEHKAYHTIMVLSGLLYVADQSKQMDRLPETMYLIGKAMYELGYMEVAKRSLAFANDDTNGECWQDGDEKYKALLEQEVKLELPEEILEMQRKIDEDVANGRYRLYTEEELDAYDEGKFEIPVIKKEERVKNLKEQGEKALKICKESAGGSLEERMQAVEKAFAVFNEEPENYPEAGELYSARAEIYAQNGENAKALEAYRKAYSCENGNRNSAVLLGMADALVSMGREKEAITYLFRTYIIYGRDFVVEHIGEERWEKAEAYLKESKDSEKNSAKNNTKDSTKNSAKDSVKNDTKDSTKNSTKDSVKNDTKDSAKNNTKDSVKNSTKDSTKNSTRDSAKDSVGNDTKDSIKDSAGNGKQKSGEEDNRTIPDINGAKEYFYANECGNFVPANQVRVLQEYVDKFNDTTPGRRKNADLLELFYYASEGMHPAEFAQAVGILVVSRQNSYYYASWQEFAHIAWDYNDLEFCREFVLRFINEQSRSAAKKSRKEFIPLAEENEDRNIADILGIIMDDLQGQNRLDEEACRKILDDFARPLTRWRNMRVPKYLEADAYEVAYELVEKCFEYRLYKAAIRMSGLLLVTDMSKKDYMSHLDKTNWLLGRLMYEMGYMAAAKECFVHADERSGGACWEGADGRYKKLLEQDVKLEITEEVHKKQQELNHKFENGRYALYTANQLRKHRLGQEKITLVDYKKLEKERNKLGEKAKKVCEKAAAKSREERLKAIDSAFAVFTEEAELYEAAAYLYAERAGIYMETGEFKKAYTALDEACRCKNGKRNGLVLLYKAFLLNKMGRMEEAEAYLFRAYILCGRDFILDKAGEEYWETVKKRLAKSRGKCKNEG